MKPAPFTYHDPATLAEAASLLSRLDNARPLAGGQSLMPMMNFRLATPDHLVDLNAVGELTGMRIGKKDLWIGAMTRQRVVEFSTEVGQAMPILGKALRQVGHRQTRNRGTVGGSLCHLDPAAELVNLAALHDAMLHVHSSQEARDLTFTDFALGYMTAALAPDELLTGITFEIWPPGHGYAFVEMSRRHGDFAIVAVGALLVLASDGTIARAALAVSGLGPLPHRPQAAEQSLLGQSPGHEAFRAAAAAAQGLEAIGDVYASASYRQHLARILTYRALEQAAIRAEPGGAP